MMTKQRIEGLLCDLAEQTLDYPASDQQKQLLERVNRHMHDWSEAEPVDPSLLDTLKLLMIEFEDTHPKTAVIIEDLLEALGKIGI